MPASNQLCLTVQPKLWLVLQLDFPGGQFEGKVMKVDTKLTTEEGIVEEGYFFKIRHDSQTFSSNRYSDQTHTPLTSPSFSHSGVQFYWCRYADGDEEHVLFEDLQAILQVSPAKRRSLTSPGMMHCEIQQPLNGTANFFGHASIETICKGRHATTSPV